MIIKVDNSTKMDRKKTEIIVDLIKKESVHEFENRTNYYLFISESICTLPTPPSNSPT